MPFSGVQCIRSGRPLLHAMSERARQTTYIIAVTVAMEGSLFSLYEGRNI